MLLFQVGELVKMEVLELVKDFTANPADLQISSQVAPYQVEVPLEVMVVDLSVRIEEELIDCCSFFIFY